MPVLPAVPSTTVPPGFSTPRCSASRMIASAARSFTEPPGFMNSALPRILQPVSSEARRRRISGVLPMAARQVVGDRRGDRGVGLQVHRGLSGRDG